jgi:hypothetical protein
MAKKNPTEEMKKGVKQVYKEMEKITPKKLGADALPKKKEKK